MHEYSKDISGSEDTVVSIPEEPQVKKVPQVKFVGYNGSHCFPGVEEFSTTELRGTYGILFKVYLAIHVCF